MKLVAETGPSDAEVLTVGPIWFRGIGQSFSHFLERQLETPVAGIRIPTDRGIVNVNGDCFGIGLSNST
jgi:hypothetical protein